jgi:ABC-type glycerol-3-phosphate transport system substrate-binding protein
MPRRLVLTVFIILGVAIAAAIWIGSREYQKSRPRTLAAAQIAVVHPVTIWAYGDPFASAEYHRVVNDLQTVVSNRLLLKVYSSRGETLSALKDAASKNRLPDVFMGEVQDFAPFHAAGQLRPILLKDTPSSEWIPDVFNAFIRNETMVAYPSEYALQVLYFNRRHFDRVGIGYPDTHWNWETLVEICRALYRSPEHAKGIVYALEFNPNFEWWNSLAYQAGDGLYRGPAWLWFMPESAPAIRESLQFMIDLYKTYTFCAPPTSQTLPPQFVQGNAALAIAGPGLRLHLQKDPNFQWGTTLVPRKNNLATPLYARGWTVTADTKSPETAVNVAQALSLIVAEGWLNARASRAASDEMTNDYTTVFQVALRYAKPPYYHPKNGIVKTIVDQSLERLGQSGELSPDDIMTDIEAALAPLELPAAATVIPLQLNLKRPTR